jgi:hypothetical protein
MPDAMEAEDLNYIRHSWGSVYRINAPFTHGRYWQAIELAMLPAGKYPRVVECAGPMTACDDPEFHYSFGIELFIAGVKAAADRLA